MTSKMLIDASHPEETRVVVTKGNRVEEFDFESALRKQLRGNIYLAKVTRVEPSLQAAFVDFGGNRHGFLAFSEIHPDYYQIPVADRQALLEDEARAANEEEEAGEERRQRRNGRRRRHERPRRARNEEQVAEVDQDLAAADAAASSEHAPDEGAVYSSAVDAVEGDIPTARDAGEETTVAAEAIAVEQVAVVDVEDAPAALVDEQHERVDADQVSTSDAEASEGEATEAGASDELIADGEADSHGEDAHAEESHGEESHGEESNGDEQAEEIIEQIGGDDALEEVSHRTFRPRRQYKIQEVIKRRQILLVQVVKEERGNKGAALTTYLSLAGRYSVLMPNTARGGGISRKITSADDRKRLKAIATELEVPEGMGVILRTAGAARTKVEVKRDFEYLMRLWESVRELTLQSTAPALVYEEGSLIKRAIRDLYTKDVEEVLVAGDEGYREAKDFMKMLMPSHAKMVKAYKEHQPVFARYGVEQQLDAMFNNVVTLRSGGYIVINQTEALVSIDVNSGRATREHNIEDTALKTNLEAAEEVARQLRLRDLAGLIVIDFIDMEEKRNNRAVERKINDCLKNDRARIQLGRISHFGLLEMSRQRIRTGVLESSTTPCPHCAGTGLKRATASIALNLVRALEEALLKNASYDVVVRTPMEIALYVLNHKREMLMALEGRFGVHISIKTDETIFAPQYYQFERGELATRPVTIKQHIDTTSVAPSNVVEEEEEVVEDAATEQDEDEASAEGEDREGRGDVRRRRRRRRRRNGRGFEGEAFNADAQDTGEAGDENGEAAEEAGAERDGEEAAEGDEANGEQGDEANGDDRPRRRRRRRGGRRNRRDEGGVEAAEDADHEGVHDRSAGSRTIEIKVPNAEVEPDVEVNNRPDIMGDEGPVAVSNPYNEPEEVRAAAHDAHIVDPKIVEADEGPVAGAETAEDDRKRPALFSEEELAAEDTAARPKRSGWWAKAKKAISG